MSLTILFIGNSASRTGAPILLLSLLKWIRMNSDIQFEIILKYGGVLEQDFRELGPTLVFYRKQDHSLSRLRRFASRLLCTEEKQYDQLRKRYRKSNIDLIYSNTLANGELIASLATLDCPVICHVHELDYWIRRSGKTNFQLVKEYSTHYIAVANAVKKNLVGHGIPAKAIDVIYGYIPIEDGAAVSFSASSLRNSIGVPADAFVVGGAGGSEDWRKGKDLFVQLALRISNLHMDRDIHLVWVGNRGSDDSWYNINQDIKKGGVDDSVHFVGEVSNPLDYFDIFDVFALVSREDPYPLVCLEAASLGKPILCFDNAGGMPEFVQNDAGFIVPYLDVEAMAKKVIELKKNPRLSDSLGQNAANKVREQHSLAKTAPKILQIIGRYLG